eukprot:UN08886
MLSVEMSLQNNYPIFRGKRFHMYSIINKIHTIHILTVFNFVGNNYLYDLNY